MTDKELEQIYNEAYRAVYWTAMSLLKNEADAEDIVQDTFVAFIESYSDIKDTSKAVALLKRIAANKCLNRLKLSRTDTVEDEFFENVEAIPEDFLPDTIIESAEMRKIVMDIINNSLSEDIRRTLILFYFDEMSTKEIAELLGIPQGTVLWRLNFAKKKIKKEVEKYEEDNDTKLFGMAIPFLTKLFIKESEQVAFKPMPASLANLSASVKASGKGVNIKASTEAIKKGTDSMKTKIIFGSIGAVVAIGVAIGIIIAVGGKKKEPKPELKVDRSGVETLEKEDETEATTTTAKLDVNKDFFLWNGNNITGLSDEGRKQKELVIPADCEGITGMLNDGVYTKIFFEDDKDVDFGIAFCNSTSLEYFYFPKNQTSLMPMAFQDCTSLKSIEIPDGITELPSFTFLGCTSLEEVILNDNITSIGAGCFNSCTSLTEIKLPSSLKTLELQAFAQCSALKSIELPDGLETIEDSVFTSCGSLTSLRIPSSVKTVGHGIIMIGNVADVYIPADLEFTEWERDSFFTEDTLLNVHVSAGSWADTNFDKVFIGAVKTYD